MHTTYIWQYSIEIFWEISVAAQETILAFGIPIRIAQRENQ